MKLKNFFYKLKFKKAGLSNFLSFVLLFNLFFGLMAAMIFNSITQEKRSMVIDFINQEAMTLQSKLNGYSSNSKYCFMYDSEGLMTYAKATKVKNDAIALAKKRIEDKFKENRYKNQMVLNSVNIDIIDNGTHKDVAKVKITVNYKALFRAPFNDEEGKASDNTAGKLGVTLKDTAYRTIENPIRVRNLKS